MKKRRLLLLSFCIVIANIAVAKEYHVAKTGDDTNDGSRPRPFKSISRAVAFAMVGDTVTVHKGVYREWVDPIRGGNSETERILYRAAAGEQVEIKGSELVTGWKKQKNGVWKVVLPNSFFKGYNSCKDSIKGDWFKDWGRVHHTADVFLNGEALYEKEKLDMVINAAKPKSKNVLGSTYTWYCESDANSTTIWAKFHGFNPNRETVEISVRPTCFYPSKPGINYITVSGFEFSQAATQWAAPTAEQIGMVATHWNKGWVIENNIIHDSRCSGITLGKERGTGHNVWLEDPSKDGSLHYIEVIFKALRIGWAKDNVGSHVVRNNEIYNCEQVGICGSFGAAFSTIENNHIHDIYKKRQFIGSEIAGLKFHGAIDVLIKKNRVNNSFRGFWLDWMTQGTRITQNLMYNNDKEDMWFEVNHGPYLVDNNILLSEVGVVNQSTGGAYVNNLFAGKTRIWAEGGRFTPYHLPHSTELAGVAGIITGDERYYNNIFVGVGQGKGVDEFGFNYYGLSSYNDSIKFAWESTRTRKPQESPKINNNVYCNGALPYKNEADNVVEAGLKPEIEIIEEGESVYLSINFKNALLPKSLELINTSFLGKAKTTALKYENPDGSPLVIDYDFGGNKRSNGNNRPGPFSKISNGANKIKVW